MISPHHHHAERHFTSGDVVRDVVIGMSDGLTVPFALAAGLTGAIEQTGLIVVAGLAEIAAGAIAMGLGGYLAAKSAAEHYASERARERREVHEKPAAEEAEVMEVLETYGVKADEAAPVVRALRRRPEAWVDFMMRFELGLERPDPRRAVWSALTIGASYVAGGFIPLASYMIFHNVRLALGLSVVVTLLALLGFGYVKGRFTGTRPLRSGLQTTLIGGLAAGAAFAIARAIS
jgi:VIT1/CCC1 family predicted Fe2+/Mn2+ transporter